MEPPRLTPHVKTIAKIIDAKQKPIEKRTRLENLLIQMIWAQTKREV